MEAPRHLLAQGVHSADEPMSRRLPLLHVRAAAAPRRARVFAPGRGARDRAGGGCCRLPRGALHARRQARAALPGRTRGARAAGLRDDARIPGRDGEAGAARDRPLAASEPGRDDARGPGGTAARERVHGVDARGRRAGVVAAWGAAFRLARQGGGAALGDDPAGRRTAHPIHDGDPGRDRRDACRADRGARRDPRAGRAVRARPGGDRPELPGEIGDADGGRAGARPGTCRRRPTSPTRSSRGSSTPVSTTGAVSHP